MPLGQPFLKIFILNLQTNAPIGNVDRHDITVTYCRDRPTLSSLRGYVTQASWQLLLDSFCNMRRGSTKLVEKCHRN
jgi:hypothetical protein